eukprot:CAMPEP_0170576034 /NCGR_PEP_ID=MMETSP0224-20130122/4178_1 /TAXON_ID=285029 /ORGANISM="Togula jolla, Strain CCCM 725" /LENGTH=361 /DNA_ID=CAMNT_0010898851 /DNA_START=1 /DNA_END=1086 /DNA_ORIENTATION=-
MLIAAGHAASQPGLIRPEPGVGDNETFCILKSLDRNEAEIYSSLKKRYQDDPILDHMASYRGVLKILDEVGRPHSYLRLSNLLQGFQEPKVMDVKLGVRTFLDVEEEYNIGRQDLYQRMAKLYPRELTEEDRQRGTITKRRFMAARDANTTIGSLGFRIEGMAGLAAEQAEAAQASLPKVNCLGDACRVFHDFAVAAASTNDAEREPLLAASIAEQLASKVKGVFSAMRCSAFVEDHEFIGTSLLLVADARGRTAAFWIDFGKTVPLPDGTRLGHTKAWSPGSHEDGLFTGMERLAGALQSSSLDLCEEFLSGILWPGSGKRSSAHLRTGSATCFAARPRSALYHRSFQAALVDAACIMPP